MLVVIYDPVNGTPCADGKVVSFAKNYASLARLPYSTVRTASFLLIEALRALIVEGKIDYSHIQFQFDGDIVEHDKRGQFYWPSPFGNIYENLLNRILNG